eukprot:g32244.t1
MGRRRDRGWEAERWEEPRGPRWVKVGQAQDEEELKTLGTRATNSTDSDDGDLTMMDVPHNCVAFVTGAGGNFLRTCEEDQILKTLTCVAWGEVNME